MVQFPLTQHIPNGTTLESSHKKHSFLETQLTHQHMLYSKHDKQLSKEDGTGCRVTSGSKLHLSFSPAHRESFRTQHHFYSIPKPPNSSSRLSLISFTDLLRLRSSGLPPLSRSVWFPTTVLGEMVCNVLTFWRDVTVSTILPLLSQLYSTSNCFPPTK